MPTRYGHTNLIAQDWEALADFYVRVFDCRRVPPGRDMQGAWLDRGTGLRDAHCVGMHLRLPGWGDDGPTLEIFQYGEQAERVPAVVNRPGYGHVCFRVDDVEAKQREVLAEGGRAVGEVVHADIPGKGRITWCYVTDPEGNIVELQRWESA